MLTKSGVSPDVCAGRELDAGRDGDAVSGAAGVAQAPTAAASAAARQIGTVKAIAGTSITLTTDAGQQVVVSVPDGARILQLAPGSTNLKDAQTITLAGIAVGDRVLVTGKAGESAGDFTALRVILMKSSDIAQKHEMEQADWQKRGTGGIVSAVDAGTGTLTVMVGAKKVAGADLRQHAVSALCGRFGEV